MLTPTPHTKHWSRLLGGARRSFPRVDWHPSEAQLHWTCSLRSCGGRLRVLGDPHADPLSRRTSFSAHTQLGKIHGFGQKASAPALKALTLRGASSSAVTIRMGMSLWAWCPDPGAPCNRHAWHHDVSKMRSGGLLRHDRERYLATANATRRGRDTRRVAGASRTSSIPRRVASSVPPCESTIWRAM